MSVSGGQHPSPESLQFRVGEDGLHRPYPQTVSAVRLQDEHVGYVGEGSAVGYHARETDLLSAVVNPEGHRVLDRAPDYLEGNTGRPVRVLQEVVDGFQVQA